MVTPRRPHSLTPTLLAVLGFMAMVGPLATDMYLPAFTDIGRDLQTTASWVQLTLTAFLVGMGVGQFTLGPLSDRFGRRPVLLAALSVFAVTSVAIVFSPTVELFAALRLVQGISGAAGVVIARAIAADLSPGQTAVRALSLIAMLSALGPLVAPPLGAVVGEVWGWRGVLAVLAALAVLMLVLAWLIVAESLPHDSRHAGGFGSLARRMGGLLSDGGFVGYMLAFACGFATMMAYISASPFVGQIVLGMSPLVYALGFAASATALLAANFVNARVAVRFGPRRMLTVGVWSLMLASVTTALLAGTGTLTIPGFIACAFVITAGAGLTMSNASALALARTDAASRGSGAALLGSAQFLLGGLVSPVVGLWGEHTALPMGIVMAVVALAAFVLAVSAGRAPRPE